MGKLFFLPPSQQDVTLCDSLYLAAHGLLDPFLLQLHFLLEFL
jgi:hypothetical protein